ncbi:hypothetical protein ACHAWF_007152 [Thalassiosira exigua]
MDIVQTCDYIKMHCITYVESIAPAIQLNNRHVSASACPYHLHYTTLCHLFKYPYATRDYGLYYWRPHHQLDLPTRLIPTIKGNHQDLLPLGRNEHDPLYVYGFADLDWAYCPQIRRLLGSDCARLARGTIS